MGRGTWSWIVPDDLWEITKPLVPEQRTRPQGGGTQNAPDETVFAAIVFVLVSGCAWRSLPPYFGNRPPPVSDLVEGWAWGRLHVAVLHRLDDAGLLDVSPRHP